MVEISVLHFMKKFSLILNQLVCTGGDSLLQFVFWCCLSLTGISVLYFTREKKFSVALNQLVWEVIHCPSIGESTALWKVTQWVNIWMHADGAQNFKLFRGRFL